MSDEFDGRVLNPNDVEIDRPFWVFKRLKKLHLLERDRKLFLPEGRNRDYFQAPDAGVHCYLDVGEQVGRAKHWTENPVRHQNIGSNRNTDFAQAQ